MHSYEKTQNIRLKPQTTLRKYADKPMVLHYLLQNLQK